MRLWLKIVLGLYGAACLAALALAVIGTQGLFGTAPDGLAAVFAIALALPWSLIALPALNTSEAVVLIVLALCMVRNAAIVAGLGALIRYWLSPKHR